MLDYKESRAYSDFWRTEIVPNLRHLTDGSMNFPEYIQEIYRNNPVRTFSLPIPYVYSLEFLKRYKDNCITFNYNSPDDVAKGAAMISAIHQFQPTKSRRSRLHAMVNVHFWRNDGENDGHITSFVVYERLQDIITFTEENLDIVKQPKEQIVGFATLPAP